MFTGIVETRGTVVAVTALPDAATIAIRAPLVTVGLALGDSIAVNGVCLTVTELDGEVFGADVMGETLRRSSLGALREGSPVNLERAATLTTRLGGHLVQGHVDAVGTVLDRRPEEHWETVRFSLPSALARYVVEKGSITVDGVSLTVIDVNDDSFSVGLIPTTLAETTLGVATVGTPVNLEVDMIAKHIEKLLVAGSKA